VLGKLKSTGDGGGAGVSLASEEREFRLEDALKAALTSWPSVEFVKMERRWRGLNAEAAEAGILGVVCEEFEKLKSGLFVRVDVLGT
jgi:hypothetical protein